MKEIEIKKKRKTKPKATTPFLLAQPSPQPVPFPGAPARTPSGPARVAQLPLQAQSTPSSLTRPGSAWPALLPRPSSLRSTRPPRSRPIAPASPACRPPLRLAHLPAPGPHVSASAASPVRRSARPRALVPAPTNAPGPPVGALLPPSFSTPRNSRTEITGKTAGDPLPQARTPRSPASPLFSPQPHPLHLTSTAAAAPNPSC